MPNAMPCLTNGYTLTGNSCGVRRGNSRVIASQVSSWRDRLESIINFRLLAGPTEIAWSSLGGEMRFPDMDR